MHLIHNYRRLETPLGYYKVCASCGKRKLIQPKVDRFTDRFGRELSVERSAPAVWYTYPPLDTSDETLLESASDLDRYLFVPESR